MNLGPRINKAATEARRLHQGRAQWRAEAIQALFRRYADPDTPAEERADLRLRLDRIEELLTLATERRAAEARS